MAYGSKVPTKGKTTAPAGAFAREPQPPKWNLRYLPFGATEDAEGKLPWVYLCGIFESVNSSKDDPTDTYTTYEGRTRVEADDPDFMQDKWMLKLAGGRPTLVFQPGKRVKDFSDKPRKAQDGRKWQAEGDKVEVCGLEKKGHIDPTRVKWVGEVPTGEECKAAQFAGGTFELLVFQSKEEREKRGKGGPKMDASEVFGRA
jgi:hypothetical protein